MSRISRHALVSAVVEGAVMSLVRISSQIIFTGHHWLAQVRAEYEPKAEKGSSPGR
jgi:hypothetical protein